jgi:hypothetical protein
MDGAKITPLDNHSSKQPNRHSSGFMLKSRHVLPSSMSIRKFSAEFPVSPEPAFPYVLYLTT